MRGVSVRCLLLLLLALPVSAAIMVFPAGPTSETPVTVRIGTLCHVESASFERTGTRIVLSLKAGHPCGTPPVLMPYDIPLGLLPPGEYVVEAEGNVLGSFVVRNGRPVPYQLRPFAVATNPHGLRLALLNTLGMPDLCAGCEIEIGGVRAERDGAFVIAPPHAPGLVDVKFTRGGITTVVPGALYYFDRAANPEPSVFERILFPVLFRSGGIGGSEWRSEAVISNPEDWFVETYNNIQAIVCVTFPCGERLSPRSRTRFDGQGFPYGVALLVPRPEAPRLAFSLRVRDVSREAEGFGAEIPVVREDEMFRDDEITLLDVPADARHRAKLRIYAFPDPVLDRPRVAQVTLAGVQGAASRRFDVPLRSSCAGTGRCIAQPDYAELDLPGEAASGGRADVYVRLPDGVLGWAFVSVTNNATQQVTVVTPDGRGGKPCETPFDACR